MGWLIYALAPLGILFALISLSCILGYGIFRLAGDFWPLHKVISKVTQLLLVLSIFPIRHYLKLSWAEIGFAPKKLFFKQMTVGLGLGLLTLLPVFGFLYALGLSVVDETKVWTLGLIVKKTGISLLLALLISYVEEPLFRGVLLGGLRQKMTVWAAVLLSAIYYAALHFLENHTDIAYQDVTFWSGFELLGEAVNNWLNPVVLPAFVGLLMVGVFLGVVRTQVKQSLGLCIGFHASWVWQIKMSKDLLNINYDSPYLYLISSYDGVVGPLIAVWLLFATLAYLAYQRWSR